MSAHDDALLLESVTTHRGRLAGAFLFGSIGSRRSPQSLITRLITGVVIAAVACGACVGVSFVMNTLAQQAATQQTPQPESTPEGSDR